MVKTRPPSDQIMHDMRDFPVELFNKHGVTFLDVARSLTTTLRDVFAQMEPITEAMGQGVATPDGTVAQVEATRAPATTDEETTRREVDKFLQDVFGGGAERCPGFCVLWRWSR